VGVLAIKLITQMGDLFDSVARHCLATKWQLFDKGKYQTIIFSIAKVENY